MSGHLIGCAGAVDDRRIGTSHKLALVAFADSADDRTHIGFPGYPGVMKWANVSRARAAELIRDLVEFGYLEQHKKAHRGQRAEFIVFPNGCCELHRTPVAEPDVDVDELAAAAGVSVDQARRLLDAIHSPKGSDAPDALGGNESDAPDPITHTTTEAVENPVENPSVQAERVHKGSDAPDPFTPSENKTPLPPNPTSTAGGAGARPVVADASSPCPAHRTSHPAGKDGCRGCGRSARQLAEAAEAHRRATELEAQQRRRDAARARQVAADRAARDAAVSSTSPSARAALATARAALPAGGTTTTTQRRRGVPR